ncbi:MAG: isoprenyl transferase [Actinobacteria bacterium]|nr:isoprenyl transferase [Actinomycetota bacterium]
MFKNIVNLVRRAPDREIDQEDLLKAALDPSRMPRHVAIIMDGNGRWARSRGLPRSLGHRAGVESLREVVKISSEIGLEFLTVYAFSTENWKRPREEVDSLMDLLVEYLYKEIKDLIKNNVRVRAIGKLAELPPKAHEAVVRAHEMSKKCTGLNFNIALNYGGRVELEDAVRMIGAKVAAGELSPGDINQSVISDHLYTAGQPDPDILIRPAGDLRLSNFLLWQLAYTEFWLTDVMWPDFKRIHLIKAVVDFQRRNRRFGGLNE